MKIKPIKKIWNTLWDIQTKVSNIKGYLISLENAEKEKSGYSIKLGRKKDSCAVKLGRLGGKKGGLARARALSPRRRKQIAKLAANARWAKAK